MFCEGGDFYAFYWEGEGELVDEFAVKLFLLVLGMPIDPHTMSTDHKKKLIRNG